MDSSGPDGQLSPDLLTDIYTYIHNHHIPPQASRRALLVLLRSWAGVALLASNERKGLKALLHGVLGDASVDPSVRMALFEVLEALLRPLVRFVGGGTWMRCGFV